ncbi:Nn.00g046220.m01.CDS01 [Neocucurbitaria sp. VM-36]
MFGQKRRHNRDNAAPSGLRTINLSPSPEPPSKRRPAPASRTYDFRLAIDFGTKYTSVAWNKGEGSKTPIFNIQGFPDDPLPNRAGTQVPTEITYLREKIKRDDEQQSVKRIYGYEFIPQHDLDDGDYEVVGHVANVKLLLDKSPHLKHLRKDLMLVLNKLKTLQVIKKHENVIYDLLVCYLRHTKEFLQRDHGLNDSSKVEITFCVPVCWKPSANTTMSGCLQEAMKKVHLGVDGRGVYNLFMVNEAEAAAMYTLTSAFLQPKWGEVFLLLDCGGGTTDAGVYSVGREYPFRLGREIIRAAGVVCGSGDLNRRFREFAIQQLKGATYLVQNKLTLENIIDSEIMPRFETEHKRSFSLKIKHKSKRQSYGFLLRGLQEIEKNNRIRDNAFVLSFEDMEAIFMPSLKTIAELMESQITKALEHGDVDKVALAGGFGDSPALKEFLADTIASINHDKNTYIKLMVTPPNTGAAGVAEGALLRAQNKEHGPERVPRLSIGIYHHVRNDTGLYCEEVLEQDDWEFCDLDGEDYIRDTIKWIIKVGHGSFESVHEFQWEDLHIFTPAHIWGWIAEYKLFASDECTEDYYRRSHARNWGKTFDIGKVLFDLFPIKEHIELYVPKDEDDGAERYECTILIKMKLIDSHLEFTAYWPATGLHQITIKGRHNHMNVVSAFNPGTA